jgi:hypothetical protein
MTKIMLAVCAAFLSVVAIVATEAAVDDPGGAQSAGPVPGSPAATAASLPAADQPTVDYTLDLDNGLMTPLPDAIINSLGPTYVGVSTYDWDFSRYAYSPEASKLAYIGEDRVGSHDPHLFVGGIDGTGIRQLTDHPPICCAATPAWSPDGTKIVFDSPQGIHVVEVDSGSLTKVVPLDPNGYEAYKDPTFSPDAMRIIYTDHHRVRAVSVTGGPSTLLFGGGTGGIGDASNASVSPDGTRVTMIGGMVPGGCCYRVVGNIDGTDMRPLTEEPEIWSSNASGTWSPDGDRILAGASVDGIAVIDVSTGQVEVVARGNGAIWLDDHTLLVEVS